MRVFLTGLSAECRAVRPQIDETRQRPVKHEFEATHLIPQINQEH